MSLVMRINKKNLTLGAFAGFVVAAGVTFSLLTILNKSTDAGTHNGSIKQSSAQLEEYAYKEVAESKYDEAISLFERALSAAQSEGAGSTTQQRLQQQIDFTTHQKRLVEERKIGDSNEEDVPLQHSSRDGATYFSVDPRSTLAE